MMPQRDFYHDTVKNALIKDGWTITHDPLVLFYGPVSLQVDLGAENLISADKGTEKIAVEIKNFRGESDLNELEKAMGQYTLYREIMATEHPDRKLYLAVEEEAYIRLFSHPIGQIAMRAVPMNLIVFNANQEVFTQWNENNITERS